LNETISLSPPYLTLALIFEVLPHQIQPCYKSRDAAILASGGSKLQLRLLKVMIDGMRATTRYEVEIHSRYTRGECVKIYLIGVMMRVAFAALPL